MRLISLSIVLFTNLTLACSNFSGVWEGTCTGVGTEFVTPRWLVSQKGCEEITLGHDSFVTDGFEHDYKGVKYTATHEENNLNIEARANIDDVKIDHAFRFTNGTKPSLHVTLKRIFKGKQDLNAICRYIPSNP